MRRFSDKPSFEVKTANKDHICVWCGNTIAQGSKYYSKAENNAMIDKLLEQETGFDIRTIKARTHFFYCDRIAWPFCSFDCMSNFAKHTWETWPFSVRERMDTRIIEIVKKIKDVVNLMTALGSSEGKTEG